jgi:hypothetical protein
MLYQEGKEVIVTNREGDVYNGKFVSHTTKVGLKVLLDRGFDNYKAEKNSSLIIQQNNIKPSNTILTRLPVMINVIAGRGYKNVLFVGYYNEEETNSWINKTTKEVTQHSIPYEARNISHICPFNLSYQLIPLVHKYYDWGFNMTVLQPPAERNRGVVHYLYRAVGVTTTPANKQYKFGSESTILQEPLAEDEYKYDAVIFAGMPKKYNDTSFTVDDIKAEWAPYCTPDFEIVDIVYQAKDYLRFTDHEQKVKDIEPQITKAFSARAEVDSSMLVGRPTYFLGNKDGIQVY